MKRHECFFCTFVKKRRISRIMKRFLLIGIGIWGMISCVTQKKYTNVVFEKMCMEGIASQYIQDIDALKQQIAKMEADRLKLLQDTIRLFLDVRNREKELADMREKSRLETGRVMRQLNNNQREAAVRLQSISDIRQLLKRFDESLFRIRDDLGVYVIDIQGITLAQDNGKVTVVAADDQMFQGEDNTVSKTGKELVNRITPLLKTYPDVNIVVAAYVDSSVVHQKKTWDRQAQRVIAVSDLLLQDTTIVPNRVSVSVSGDDRLSSRSALFNYKTDTHSIYISFVPNLNMLYELIRENQ